MAVEWTVVLAGESFTNEDFENHGYADVVKGFGQIFLAALSHFATVLKATSADSLSVTAASKAFDLDVPFGAFAVGMPVRIARTSAPTTTYMDGQVTAFDGLGAITVNVFAVVGSGTHSDWTISVGGTTTTAATPVSIADGGHGANTGSVGLGNLTAAIAKIVTTENTITVGGVACYVVGDDEYPQWYDGVDGGDVPISVEIRGAGVAG